MRRLTFLIGVSSMLQLRFRPYDRLLIPGHTYVTAGESVWVRAIGLTR
jgi:hypothetical protein